MKNMSISNEFVPTVPPTSSPPAASGLKTVTVGAGVQLGEMYAFLGARGLMAVGGTFSTVGMAGGYIQGGGHSFLGWMHGMASDNVLEFQVVLADVSARHEELARFDAPLLTPAGLIRIRERISELRPILRITRRRRRIFRRRSKRYTESLPRLPPNIRNTELHYRPRSNILGRSKRLSKTYHSTQ